MFIRDLIYILARRSNNIIAFMLPEELSTAARHPVSNIPNFRLSHTHKVLACKTMLLVLFPLGSSRFCGVGRLHRDFVVVTFEGTR